MFRKFATSVFIVRYFPVFAGISMGVSLFFGMSFALWGPDSDRTWSAVFMLLAIVLLSVLAIYDDQP